MKGEKVYFYFANFINIFLIIIKSQNIIFLNEMI